MPVRYDQQCAAPPTVWIFDGQLLAVAGSNHGCKRKINHRGLCHNQVIAWSAIQKPRLRTYPHGDQAT